jgi:hypothetical protein
MDEAAIKNRILELAKQSNASIASGYMDELISVWRRGYSDRMPGWVADLLPVKTLENRVYRDGHWEARVFLSGFLCLGRTKIVYKKDRKGGSGN